MRSVPSLVLRDPSLRMVAGALLLQATFASSLGVHQSLLAVRVFGLPDAAYAGVLLGAMLASVSASVAMGIATDRGPHRRAMALLAAGCSLAGAALVWATGHLGAFLLAHLVLVPVGGTLFGQVFAVARLASARYARPERDAILSVLRACFAIPFMIVLPLWGLALDRGLPLLDIYPVVALVALGLVLLLWRAFPAADRQPWAETRSGLSFRASLSEMAARPVVGRVVLLGVVHTGGALAGTLIGLLFARVGRSPGDVGIFFGLFVGFEVLGTLAVGALVRHVPRLWLIATGVGLYAGFLVLLPFLAHTSWLWLLIVPAGLGGGLIYTLAIAYLQDLLAARPGAGSSLIAVQQVAAQGLTTAIYGVGAWAQGYATVALLGASASVLAMGAILRIDRAR